MAELTRAKSRNNLTVREIIDYFNTMIKGNRAAGDPVHSLDGTGGRHCDILNRKQDTESDQVVPTRSKPFTFPTPKCWIKENVSKLSTSNSNETAEQPSETLQANSETNSIGSTILERKEWLPKFIPIDSAMNEVVPASDLDTHYPRCLFELQKWYSDIQAVLGYHDGDVSEGNKKESEMAESSYNRSKNSDHDLIPQYDLTQSGVFKEANETISPLTDFAEDPRFDFAASMAYCHIASKENVHFIAELYIVLDKRADIQLCRVKTELIVLCLQKFFFPSVDVHVMWVSELGPRTLGLEADQYLQPVLPGHPRIWASGSNSNCHDISDGVTSQLQAVLIVSPDAAAILKHDKLAFFDALCTTADIRRDQLTLFKDMRLLGK